jgi:hypothetical protein
VGQAREQGARTHMKYATRGLLALAIHATSPTRSCKRAHERPRTHPTANKTHGTPTPGTRELQGWGMRPHAAPRTNISRYTSEELLRLSITTVPEPPNRHVPTAESARPPEGKGMCTRTHARTHMPPHTARQGLSSRAWPQCKRASQPGGGSEERGHCSEPPRRHARAHVCVCTCAHARVCASYPASETTAGGTPSRDWTPECDRRLPRRRRSPAPQQHTTAHRQGKTRQGVGPGGRRTWCCCLSAHTRCTRPHPPYNSNGEGREGEAAPTHRHATQPPPEPGHRLEHTGTHTLLRKHVPRRGSARCHQRRKTHRCLSQRGRWQSGSRRCRRRSRRRTRAGHRCPPPRPPSRCPAR